MKTFDYGSGITDMKWNLCTLDGESIKIPLTFYEGNGGCGRDGGVIFNDSLYQTLHEIYYTVSYQRINETEYGMYSHEPKDQISPKESCLNTLAQLDKDHSSLLLANKIFFCEVHGSLQRLDSYMQDQEPFFLEDQIISFSNKFLHVVNKFSYYSYTVSKLFLIEYFTNNKSLSEVMWLVSQKDPASHKRIKKSIDSILDSLQKDLKKHPLGLASRTTVAKIEKFINLIRKCSVFGIYGEIIWFINFLYKYRKIVSIDSYDINEHLTFHPLTHTMDLHDFIDFVRNYISSFMEWSNQKMYAFQNDMLLCYSAKISRRNFDSEVTYLLKCLKLNKSIWHKYSFKSQNGCFAAMNFKGGNFAALSGVKVNNLENDIQKILSGKYELVTFNRNVRYYYCFFKCNKYIQYSFYEKYSDEINRLVEKGNFKLSLKRMFSCCEKKLLTVLYGKTGQYTIYVKYNPCRMCVKALDDYDNHCKKMGQVKYAIEKKQISDHDLLTYDKMAQVIENTYLCHKGM